MRQIISIAAEGDAAGVNVGAWDSETLARARNTVLFQDAPPGVLERALGDARCVSAQAPRGETIYTPQVFSRSLGILIRGEIEVSKQALLVSILKPGDLFGAAALFNDAEGYATTLTARRACSLLFFSQPLVEELIAECPAAARGYIRYLTGRVRFLSGKIEGLIAGSAERKLAQYLLEEMRGDRVELGCSVTGLAQRLNVSRASLYRAFDALAALGVAKKEGKLVCILDIDRLRTV